MKVYKLVTNSPLKNFNYFIQTSHNEVWAVDPLYKKQVDEWLKINNFNLAGIFITHNHPDHVAGALEYKSQQKNQNQNQNQNEKQNQIKILAMNTFTGDKNLLTNELNDGDKFEFENGEIEIIYTPGHTIDHFCLLVKDQVGKQKSIITMDTVFNAGVGNCKNGGNPETLYNSIQKLLSILSDHTILYPGHDYMRNNLNFSKSLGLNTKLSDELLSNQEIDREEFVTTIKIEKEINVFFKAQSVDEFVSLRKKRDTW